MGEPAPAERNTRPARRPPAPRAGPGRRPRAIPWFDVLGGLAVAAFVAVLAVDLRALGRPRDEVSLHVDPTALAEGFREGVQWYGLYRGLDKLGFSRTERRRRGAGYLLAQTIELPPSASAGATRITVQTELDAAFVLERFTVTAEGGPIPLRAEGEHRDGTLYVEAEGLPGLPALEIPLRQPPVFDWSLGPLVMTRDLRPGDRFAFTHVDPLALTPTEGSIEYLGRVDLDVLGERISAFHLRQRLPGLPPLQLWVNEIGEVLQQELPLELLAVREAEAQATYGVLAPRAASEAAP